MSNNISKYVGIVVFVAVVGFGGYMIIKNSSSSGQSGSVIKASAPTASLGNNSVAATVAPNSGSGGSNGPTYSVFSSGLSGVPDITNTPMTKASCKSTAALLGANYSWDPDNKICWLYLAGPVGNPADLVSRAQCALIKGTFYESTTNPGYGVCAKTLNGVINMAQMSQ